MFGSLEDVAKLQSLPTIPQGYTEHRFCLGDTVVWIDQDAKARFGVLKNISFDSHTFTIRATIEAGGQTYFPPITSVANISEEFASEAMEQFKD